MNKKKGKLLQKMTALLLSILLIAEALQSAGPIKVLAQEADIASGTDWVLDADGKLTISSNEGMTDWYINLDTYKEQVITAELSDNLQFLRRALFYGCSNLTSVNIPSATTTINESVFYNCSSLTTITIPSKVIVIAYGAFENCSSLENVIMEPTVPPELNGSNIFNKCKFVTENQQGIKVPSEAVDVYKNAWTDWVDYIAEDSQSSTNIASGTDWVLDADGKLTISSNAGVSNWYNDRTNAKQVITIEIQNGVTKICDNAFYGLSNLTAITIPSDVTSIGQSAFRDCSSIASIEIPAGVGSIENDTFFGCSSLTNVVIPDSVTSIGDQSFYNCSSLKSITIPDHVTNIGKSSFYNCNGLESITIPSGMTNVKRNAFALCRGLKNIVMSDGITTIEQGAFDSCSSLTSITIPSTVTSIGPYAFMNCSDLTNVTMQSATPPTIDTRVFDNCKFVTENQQGIKVPSEAVDTYKTAWTDWANYIEENSQSSTNIASGTDWVLDKDGKLIIQSQEGMSDWYRKKNETYSAQVISVEIKDGVKTIPGQEGHSAFSECSNLKSVTIPDSVTYIIECAFSGCSSLVDITLPSGLQTIGSEMFKDCSSLTNIEIPSSVTTIAGGAFSGCSSLGGITIPDGVISIGFGAFEDCSSLKDLTIPGSVTSIAERAFSGCGGLESVTMQGSTPPTLGETSSGTKRHFEGCKFVTENTKGIHVPAGTVDAYKTAWADWADYIADDSEPSGELIASGTDWTLDKNGKLTIMSDSGMKDWERAIDSLHEKVISVEIKDGVTSIPGNQGYTVFFECSNLTSITIPDSVTSIGAYAFYMCRSLTNITIPDKVTSIGEFAFYGCSSLTNITLPSGVTSIERFMLSGCGNLASITISGSVTNIEECAFYGCSSLTDITLPDSVTSIERSAFFNCGSLVSITIPSGVTSLGASVFRKCSSLESVTMLGNTPLTLKVYENVTKHFDECKFVTENTKGIHVPAGTADAYKAAWTEWADYITEDSTPVDDKTKVEAAKKAVENALAAIQVSNATTKESLQAAIQKALEEAGADDGVTVKVEDFVRTDATTKAPGSIDAGIKITSGAESASVSVKKIIAQLPDTPADKVAAAKKAVEDAVKKAVETALAGTTVTNDNAEEVAAQITALLPDVIAGALEEAEVSAADIGIGEVGIKIEPATADSEGNIKVTIPVASKEDVEQSENAEVQITIAKSGGESNPDKDAEEAQKTAEDALNNLTITNETTPEDILAALKEAYGDKATVENIEELEKENATEDSPGKLKLQIKLTINGKTIYVIVNVPIAQLSKRTGVYVRFTDYYDLVDSMPRYKYTGAPIKPAVEVYNNETLLTPGKDYTIGYKNNTKVGSTAALTVKGKGNFSGTSNVVNFTITHADIDQDTDHPAEMTVTVNTKVAPIIMNGAKKLTAKDYKLEGEGLVNGKYTAATAAGVPNILTVKGIGSYEGSSFEMRVTVIEKSAAKKLAVTVDKNFKPVYDGDALNLSSLIKGTDNEAGVITVTDSKDKTKMLKEGVDFTIVCTSSLSNAGTVKFTVTGMGEYTGSVSKTFKIAPLKVTDSSKFSVTFDEDKAYEYKSAGVTVDNLIVKYLGETNSDTDDEVLTQGVDYKVTYSNNKKVSGTKEAGFKITFLGNYKGSSAVSKTFKVVTAKLSASNTAVTVPDKVYNKANQAYKSTPIVTVDGVTIKASNYTVSYAWATESQAGDDTKYVSDNKVKITIADGDTYAKVKVTIALKETGSYGLAEGAVIAGEYYVRRADEAVNLSKAKVTFYNKEGTQLKTLEYNGNTFYTPAGNNPEANNAPEDPNAVYVKVTVNGAVIDPSLYDVTWTNATAKGKATVVICGKGISTAKGIAVGSKNQAINIKAMVLKGKTLKSYMKNAASNLKNLFF